MHNNQPAVYSIPAWASFLDTLATTLLAETAGDPLQISHYKVLLPNRRACRALKSALIKHNRDKIMLLPQLMALGDLDTGEVIAPPTVPNFERLGILMSLMLKHGKAVGAAHSSGYGQAGQALALANELTALIDQAEWENISFAELESIVATEFAQHWQITLEFLKIVTEFWPQILQEAGVVNPSTRGRILLEAYAQQWTDLPPTTPVIAAGSTGTIPATADLLRVIASLPRGRIILPGIDFSIDEDKWQQLEVTHPQYNMAQLLSKLQIPRTQVQEIRIQNGCEARLQVISKAMQATDWQLPPAQVSQALENLKYIECSTPQEEACSIALLMREALEVPAQTIALITPDRNLVKMVMAELQRWDLHPDDSAGTPLSETTAGTFALLLAELLANPDSAINLLAVLKHPLANVDSSFIQDLELDLLRASHTADDALEDGRLKPIKEGICAFSTLSEACLSELISIHLTTLKALNPELSQQNPDLEAFFNDLLKNAGSFPKINIKDYTGLLKQLMQGIAVRQPHGYHPRLFVWGPLEARIQKTDVAILAGLNEGTWPSTAQADPWINRPMREDIGLPLPERRIGLSAHDFTQAFCSPKVFMTRAARVDGTPTVPSRWILRLQTVLKASGVDEDAIRDTRFPKLQQMLDSPKQIKSCPQPAPCPPVNARPRKLSVTQIETWMQDPYAVYARHILKLKPLNDLEAQLSAAEKGSLIHRALELFTKSIDPKTKNAITALEDIGKQVFAPHMHEPLVSQFWWPRFQRIAKWFVGIERERCENIETSYTEINGQVTIGNFTVTAKADRIDVLKDGSLAIIDYKTGTVPSTADVRNGYAPQLPLEAAIATTGNFEGVNKHTVHELSFWRLTGGTPAGQLKPIKLDPTTLGKEALDGLRNLIIQFDNPATPYRAQPRPEKALRFNDYAHLARIQEWAYS